MVIFLQGANFTPQRGLKLAPACKSRSQLGFLLKSKNLVQPFVEGHFSSYSAPKLDMELRVFLPFLCV